MSERLTIDRNNYIPDIRMDDKFEVILNLCDGFLASGWDVKKNIPKVTCKH